MSMQIPALPRTPRLLTLRALPGQVAVALLLCSATLSSPLHAAGGFEQPPTLSAAKLVPAKLLKGKHYKVDARVPTDGFLTRYTIRSDFGTFSAVGPGMLDVRIREIQAIAKLQQVEQEEQFKKGASKSISDVSAGVQNFIDKPEETLKGIPDGVGRFFQRSYRNAKTGVQKLQDRQHGKVAGAPPADGPGSHLPGGVAGAQPAAGQGNVYADAARALGGATADALGFDEDRRRLARELGVDPYTTNAVLDKKMNEVTWAAFAGNLGVDVATAMIPGGAILSSSQRFSEWVWDTPPGDMRVAMERNLRAMRVSQRDIDLLLRHRWYSLSMQAALVAALKDLGGVQGRSGVMPLALTVASEEQANFMMETVRMLARYHNTVKPLKRLRVAGTVIADAKDGELVVAAPVDYLSWNPTLAKFTGQKGLDAKRYSVHLAGKLTRRAREELERGGWKVYSDSKLFDPIIPAVSSAK